MIGSDHVTRCVCIPGPGVYPIKSILDEWQIVPRVHFIPRHLVHTCLQDTHTSTRKSTQSPVHAPLTVVCHLSSTSVFAQLTELVTVWLLAACLWLSVRSGGASFTCDSRHCSKHCCSRHLQRQSPTLVTVEVASFCSSSPVSCMPQDPSKSGPRKAQVAGELSV